jgi:hypothetical protein
VKALVLAALAGAAPAAAQVQPFVFTVTTSGASTTDRWSVRYDVGYAERSTAPFGYDGLEQRARVQGALGRGFTLLGQIALGTAGGGGTSSTQEAEVLKDVTGAGRRLQLAGGLGARREWDGTSVLLGRVAVARAFEASSLAANVRVERPLAEGRDGLDLITSIGWHHRLGGGLAAGIEAVGEDLEGFWEAEEAEGGARLFVGPSLRFAASPRVFASLCGGPIVRATRTDRRSDAARGLPSGDDGYTVRLMVGWVF